MMARKTALMGQMKKSVVGDDPVLLNICKMKMGHVYKHQVTSVFCRFSGLCDKPVPLF